jgi:Flp pilus assembly protein TadD
MQMDTRALLAQASAAFARRDLPATDQACRRLLAQNPRNADAMHLWGLTYRQSGDAATAEKLLRASIELEPRRPEFRTNLGNLLRATGRLRDAEEQYRIALELEPASRTARLALARLLVDGKAYQAAVDEARPLVAADARDAEAWAALAAALRGSGNPVEAEAAYRKALSLKPAYAAARHNLGALLSEIGRAEESLAELDRAAELGASGRALHFNRGRALMELGRLDEADRALAEALRLAPTDLESHVLLAKLRFMRGEPDFARSLAATVESEPANQQLALTLGDLLRRADRLQDAEQVLRRLLSRGKWSPLIGSSLAVVLQEQGQLEQAVEQARHAHVASPDDAALVENLVAILLQLGEAAETWPMILRQRERQPLDQRWLAYEATAARLMGSPRYEELYDYERFVQPFDLAPPPGWSSIEALNADLIPRLIQRHGFETHPLDQSLRHGSQTPRNLLVDPDPVIQAFIRALEAPITAYRAAIGDDPSHPLTVRNHGPTRLVSCWSVRLKRGGFHVNHVHPEGWISSSYYVEVPSEVEDAESRSGWIKFGEPRMPVPGAGPAHFIQPRAGRLVLFPSYMWHGTMPIHGDEPRMTIPFDAVPG